MSKLTVSEEVAKVDEAIERWQSKLRRAVNAIKKLEAKRKRLSRKKTKLIVKPEPKPESKPEPKPVAVEVKTPSPQTDDSGIPEFLRRNLMPEIERANERIAKIADEEAAAQLIAEIVEKKKAKAKARIDKLKAKKSGETKKMPLQGKEALKFIRNNA